MRVLSIDLDYCMSSCIELYDGIHDDENPLTRWKKFQESGFMPNNKLTIDKDKVIYCFDVFTKALKHCQDVEFAYDHDAILYRLEKEKDVEIINIDYHNDFLNFGGLSEYSDGSYEQDISVLELEYDLIEKHNRVMEGNWVAWLDIHDKLKKYTWIRDKTSLTGTKEKNNKPTFTDYYWDILQDKFEHCVKEDYTFKSFEFDYIFVCLSPVYVPQKFWHNFTLFMIAYENFTNKPLKFINRKYEIEARYKTLNERLIPKNREVLLK